MNEQDFFANIAARLGRNAPLSVTPRRDVIGAPDFWKQADAHPGDPVDTFQRELEALGGEVHVIEGVSALGEALQDQLARLRPQRVGCWGGEFLNEYNLQEVLSPYTVVTWGEHGVEEYQSVDVSITGCAYAIADTGTIVMMSSPTRGRSAAVLPAVHVVIIHASQIRHRLGEVLEEIALNRASLPSSIHFISGPSRSSDIENDQTIGIHGPAAVVAYVLRC
ncbi:MAG: LUD domain-containing protein [Alicyclobacillus sp.]|nr:LUD domain-containing protein [Alicyclobacillus sp.]